MTEKEQFITRAEHELRSTRKISTETLQLMDSFDEKERHLFDLVVRFPRSVFSHDDVACFKDTSSSDRIAASRLMLLKFRLDSSEPVWSSASLDLYIRLISCYSTESIEDAIGPICELLLEHDHNPTAITVNFIRDFVALCISKYRNGYNAVNWKRLTQKFKVNINASVSYFLVVVCPRQFISAQLASTILTWLSNTAYGDEARGILME